MYYFKIFVDFYSSNRSPANIHNYQIDEQSEITFKEGREPSRSHVYDNDNDSSSDEYDPSKENSKKYTVRSAPYLRWHLLGLKNLRKEKESRSRRPFCTRAEEQQIIEEIEDEKRQYAEYKKKSDEEQWKLSKAELKLKKTEQNAIGKRLTCRIDTFKALLAIQTAFQFDASIGQQSNLLEKRLQTLRSRRR